MAEYRTAPHAFVKAGVFYFSRRVPKDLQQHYSSSRVSFSLRTNSAPVATSRALRAAQKLDEYWYHLRVQQCDLPGKHLLRGHADGRAVPQNDARETESDAVELSEAVAVYLRLKGQNRPDTFKRAPERSRGYLIDICGNKSIARYNRKDANTFRDRLIAKGLTGSSITQVFGTVRSIINFAAAEIGIAINNAFAKVYFDQKASVTEGKPIPGEAIAAIQTECRQKDDELRWPNAPGSDTVCGSLKLPGFWSRASSSPSRCCTKSSASTVDGVRRPWAAPGSSVVAAACSRMQVLLPDAQRTGSASRQSVERVGESILAAQAAQSGHDQATRV